MGQYKVSREEDQWLENMEAKLIGGCLALIKVGAEKIKKIMVDESKGSEVKGISIIHEMEILQHSTIIPLGMVVAIRARRKGETAQVNAPDSADAKKTLNVSEVMGPLKDLQKIVDDAVKILTTESLQKLMERMKK